MGIAKRLWMEGKREIFYGYTDNNKNNNNVNNKNIEQNNNETKREQKEMLRSNITATRLK